MKEKKSSVVYDKSNERCANKSIARILERERGRSDACVYRANIIAALIKTLFYRTRGSGNVEVDARTITCDNI